MRALLVSHPTGNANVRAVLRAAESSSTLHSFWTTLAFPAGLVERSGLPCAVRRELQRRVFPEIAWRRTFPAPGREAWRLLAARARSAEISFLSAFAPDVDAVHTALDRRVAGFLNGRSAAHVRAVYAYEDSALETFRVARARGIRCLYDLPIAHWRTLRRLLAEEAELRPAWRETMKGLTDTEDKLARKDEEITLSEKIIVASSFTQSSLREHFGNELPVTVLPYGAPSPSVSTPASRELNKPLQLLFAGHLNQRKGIAYLIEALQTLDIPWSLTLAGQRPDSAPRELDVLLSDRRCRWLGHVPHGVLLEEMKRAHVFLFPSIVEGFGLVLYEAMSAGLPVITTPNTAGPDIMTSGREGFIVPIRDPDAIADRIAALYADEDKRFGMAAEAITTAKRASWSRYEEMIVELARGLVD